MVLPVWIVAGLLLGPSAVAVVVIMAGRVSGRSAERTQSEIEAAITARYLEGREFNGSPLEKLILAHGESAVVAVHQLVTGGRIDAVFAARQVNPHVKRLTELERGLQLKLLNEQPTRQVVLYPSRRELSATVNDDAYPGEPFTLEVARGAAQLEFAAFDLEVLEWYRNDPRYEYKTNDVGGHIWALDASMETLPERDRTELTTFGFAKGADGERCVAVFYRYLSQMTPEHQQRWATKRRAGDHGLHPDYEASSIHGQFFSRVPVFDAILWEMRTANEMCDEIAWEPIWRKVPDRDKRPKELSFLIRPTQKEFDDSIRALDKILSDNINKKFFPADIARDIEETQADGTIRKTTRGTLSLLEEFAGRFVTEQREQVDKMLETLKHVRKLRQKPSHSLVDDRFEQSIFRRHRELVAEVYVAVRTVRQLIENHPGVNETAVPDDHRIQRGEIWFF